jgi:hypothetical protein
MFARGWPKQCPIAAIWTACLPIACGHEDAIHLDRLQHDRQSREQAAAGHAIDPQSF